MEPVNEKQCNLKHAPIDSFIVEHKEFNRDMNKWVAHVDKKLTMIDTRYNEKTTSTTWIGIIAIFISILALILSWLHK